MTAPAFLDTNILCYTKDSTDYNKHSKAIALVEDLFHKKTARISTQVINEFYVFLKRHSKDEAELMAAKITAQSLLHLAPTPITSELQLQAWDIESRYKLSWWDSLIIAAAQTSRCEVIYTEDLQHGQKIENILIQNPLL